MTLPSKIGGGGAVVKIEEMKPPPVASPYRECWGEMGVSVVPRAGKVGPGFGEGYPLRERGHSLSFTVCMLGGIEAIHIQTTKMKRGLPALVSIPALSRIPVRSRSSDTPHQHHRQHQNQRSHAASVK